MLFGTRSASLSLKMNKRKVSLLKNKNSFQKIYEQVRQILIEGRNRSWQAINSAMLKTYWSVGKTIVENEQFGESRAEYGKKLIEELSGRLQKEFGKGFDRSNLWNIRKFYLSYPKLDAAPRELTWTHHRLLLKIKNPQARLFYEKETIHSCWSTRELDRQIGSLLFERLSLSRDKKGLKALAKKGHEIQKPQDLVKDPYILEFTGIPQDSKFLESELEKALIEKLKTFLLELGKGFAFMGHQQRITLEGQHFYIDLVLYNRLTKSFVLLDLKVGHLTHQDLGQMQMYVNYYQREMTKEGENPPIGIVLCADKNESVVKYTLSEDNKQIFASKYQLYLPTEEELAKEIQQERRWIEMEKKIRENR